MITEIKKLHFVFMHTGVNNYSHLMISSIKRLFPEAEIIQCSNKNTRPLSGISSFITIDSDESKLMKFRIDAFTYLKLEIPAVYIDTDMLFINTFYIYIKKLFHAIIYIKFI
jgi:hypothetical protein